MKYIIIILSVFSFIAQSQTINGIITDEENSPIPGANIYWQNGKTGTTSDVNGKFTIKKELEKDNLIISFVGYNNDTIAIQNQKEVKIKLKTGEILNEVTIVERKKSSTISHLNTLGTQNLSDEIFHRAACCNLSESFETNASVDVAYTDAISGSKQIEMLGLKGTYVQMMTENTPNLRGLAVSHGMDYIPGSWMESIQISKGAASVVNGYEAITGQINTEYKKPDSEEFLYLNLLANSFGKHEGNFNVRTAVAPKVSTMIFAHYENNQVTYDNNDDGFIDFPLNEQYNFFNRWKYKSDKFVAQFGVKGLKEIKKAGQTTYFDNPENVDSIYGVSINTDRYEVFYKSGYIFDRPSTSLGFVSNYIYHNLESKYGYKTYDANENSLYANLIFQSYIGNTKHSYSTGLSFVNDIIDEKYNTDIMRRNEYVPGAFFQYTYGDKHSFTYILGIRADHSNLYGTFFTPRAHIKYNFDENNTIRATAGKGYRTANVIAENSYLLANSREFVFTEELKQESAWNFGISYVKDIKIANKKLRLVADYHRTDFQNQIVLDLDADKSKVLVYNLNGLSYSNAYQLEASIEPFKRMDIVAAIKYNDVKITQNNALLDKPLTKNIIGLLTLSYATNLKKWQFDYTLQYNGTARLPQTYPTDVYSDSRTPDFVIMNFQINKFYKKWNFYAGVENLTGYKQDNPILSADDPFSDDFDASMVWAPIIGQKFFVGIKYRINKKIDKERFNK